MLAAISGPNDDWMAATVIERFVTRRAPAA
jgi:hypothetical protein